jgi:Ca-activated chloride channel family protein
MTFGAPTYLLALLVVPLLAAAIAVAARRRRKFAVRFPAMRALTASAGPSRPWRRRVPVALTLLGAAALGLALAKPQTTVAVPVERASIMLVTDVSGSMAADDVSPSRLAAAQAAAKEFVDEVPDSVQVGLVSFSDGSAVTQQPTQDHDAVKAAIDSLGAQGGTATGEALDTAIKALRPSGQPRTPAAIVLLSDGATTVGREPVPVAQEAKRVGVAVNTVALGTPDGMLMTPRGAVAVPPDPETLAQIASSSGGRAFAAEDADGLQAVYRELGSQLGTKDEQREVTAAFAAGGLLLLGAGLAGGLRNRPTLT